MTLPQIIMHGQVMLLHKVKLGEPRKDLNQPVTSLGKAVFRSPSKKKRTKRKISLASARKGRMKSAEKAKHKSG